MSSASAASPASRSEGEQLLKRIAGGDRRPGVLPVPAKSSCRTCTTASSRTWRTGISSPTRRRISRVDGAWRAVSLVTADPAYTVRAKPGYFAPKPPPVRPTLEFTVTDTARRHLSVSPRGSDRGRRRRRAGHRDLPRGHEPGLDRPGARPERQHAAGQRCREGGGAGRSSRPCDREDKLAVMRFSDATMLDDGFSTDADPTA